MPFVPPGWYRKTRGIIRQGVSSDRPLYNQVLQGTLYIETDTLLIYRAGPASWVLVDYMPGTGLITPGAVIFGGPTGMINGDPSNFSYDNTNDLLKLRFGAGAGLAIQFGGASASEVALQALGIQLAVKLADNSGYGDFAADNITAINQVTCPVAIINSSAVVPLVIGGVAANDDLTLQSTTSGTRGEVICVDPLQLDSGQIIFPGTQNPSSNPNTLDDYEEGSFSPTVIGVLGASGQTYTTQDGRYEKIGSVVHVAGRVTLSNAGTLTSTVAIGNFPFTADSLVYGGGMMNIFWSSLAANFVYITGLVVGGTTYAELFGSTAAVTGLGALLQAHIANNSDFIFSGTYRASA